jgi:antitoxin component of MazEF toxin-antitoxin module
VLTNDQGSNAFLDLAKEIIPTVGGTTAKDGELVLRPSLPSRLRLTELLAGITQENIHASIDTGAAVGAEAF